MEIEIKDVSPELRLATIENVVVMPSKNYGWIVWVIGFGVAGAVIAFIVSHKSKKTSDNANKQHTIISY